jgi:hypothetical protein
MAIQEGQERCRDRVLKVQEEEGPQASLRQRVVGRLLYGNRPPGGTMSTSPMDGT